MPETAGNGPASVPSSITRVLDLARRQSQQLERLSLEASPSERKQSIGRKSVPGRKSLRDIAAEAKARPSNQRKSAAEASPSEQRKSADESNSSEQRKSAAEASPSEQRKSAAEANPSEQRKSAAEANPSEKRKSAPEASPNAKRKSRRSKGSKSKLSRSSAMPFATELAQSSDKGPSRSSEIQPAVNSSKRLSRSSEIEPAQEPFESYNKGPRGSHRRITRSNAIVLYRDGGAEQLKELHARAVASGPRASLRRDLSYESFAKSNFRLQVYWPSQPIEEVIHFTKTRINEPLLQSVQKRDKHDAVAVFAHLMAYMGDLHKSKSETGHLLQVMSGGLRKPNLRDEIFCQICKQTTANPDSVSNVRGWQAMALSCGLFSPSARFLPVLEAHLEQVVHGIVGTGNIKGKGGEDIVDPPHLATYSLFRLRKLLRVGTRHLLPLPQEIAAVEKMGNITATIFLPDSTSKSLPLDPMVTTEEVVIKIVQILGLSESKYFCLWEVDTDQGERSLGKREYVAEVQSRWASTCIPQSINDFQSPLKNCMTCWRFANKKIATIPDLGDIVLDHLFVMKCKGNNMPKLLFKRNLFLGSQDPTISLNARNRELALDYSQVFYFPKDTSLDVYKV